MKYQNAMEWWKSQPLRTWIQIKSIPDPIFWSVWAKIERKGVLLDDNSSRFIIFDHNPKISYVISDDKVTEHSRYAVVIVRDDGKVYDSISQAAKLNNTTRQWIISALDVGSKAKGFYFEYKTIYE